MKKYEYIVADEGAFTDFYNEFAPIICNYINTYVKNIEDAKEITADLFLSLPTKIQKYDSKKGRFEVWLFIVAKNMAIDFQRKKKRRILIQEETMKKALLIFYMLTLLMKIA